jgi:hypothetical protein
MMLSDRQFEPSLSWERWLRVKLSRSTFRRLPAEQTTGIDWRKADGTKDNAGVPIETEPRKYDLVVLLALSPIRVYESIILSLRAAGTAGSE